jgi:hypothetical protein
MPSGRKIEKLARKWWGKEYPIIDEFSMVSRTLFARMSTILGLIRQHNHLEEATMKHWGGLSVIICGDCHQFKPVGQGGGTPLYWPNSRGKKTWRRK